MDYLTRSAMEHGQIYESLTVFKKLLDVQNDTASYVKMKEFFRDLIVPHFQYEEDELFRMMLKRGTAEEQALTRALSDEHEEILAAFGRFSAIFDLAAAKGAAKNTQLSELVKAISGLLLEHARKEDKSFYPALKKYILKG